MSASLAPSAPSGPLAWLRTASPAQRRTLLAASLGWMLDSMDVMVYALVMARLRVDLYMTAAVAGLIMSATLVAAAAGGTLFGRAADRFGRTRALSASILVYCVCTGLCGLVQTVWQLFFCRTLLGFGMGGEWAAGAALVAESWPEEHRGKALALVQSSWAIGYALAAALVALLMPHFGWRPVFFAGVVPALLTVWIRREVREPKTWQLAARPRFAAPDLSRSPRAAHGACHLHERRDPVCLVGPVLLGAGVLVRGLLGFRLLQRLCRHRERAFPHPAPRLGHGL